MVPSLERLRELLRACRLELSVRLTNVDESEHDHVLIERELRRTPAQRFRRGLATGRAFSEPRLIALAYAFSKSPIGLGVNHGLNAGCESMIVVELSAPPLIGDELDAEVCVDGACRSAGFVVEPHGEAGQQTRDAAASQIFAVLPDDADFDGVHDVRISVRNRSTGEVLLEHRAETTFDRHEPNGPRCPPVCWMAKVQV